MFLTTNKCEGVPKPVQTGQYLEINMEDMW